jgi:hypothetical protein
MAFAYCLHWFVCFGAQVLGRQQMPFEVVNSYHAAAFWEAGIAGARAEEDTLLWTAW